MNIRKMSAATGALLFLGGIGMVQGFGASPAAAAPASTTVVASDVTAGQQAGYRDYRQGYRDGRSDGWLQAKRDCRSVVPYLSSRRNNIDYVDGYEDGYRTGFREGYREYCD
ncbi:hypothetical protein [Actinoplanes siamensis]|uniref:Lectin-like protein BA14k n=1 Tax=Actinoplanes siamensis TaxID=1223317 RepID=A0A919N9A5_9ACTN|nr:hypothetical protein [Actinoplanes siamensis]GIF06662.1 hypothetical protein Asi03nite_42000 [Actinoplanes siamensis]